MVAGINYFRLLWNLYRQKRNAGRTKEQIGRLQKKKLEKLLRFDETSEDDGEIYLGKYHVVHSSGSTGTPRYFVYDNAAWEQMLIGIIRGALWGMSMGSVLNYWQRNQESFT